MEYLTLIIFLYLILAMIYFGKKRLGYSHLKYTISELAESGSTMERQVSYLVFLPVGLAMTCVAFFVKESEPAFLFSLSLAIGYSAAALFPIDPGAPLLGSWRNIVHNLSAGISYVLAIAAFEEVGRDNGFPYSLGKYFIIAFIISLYAPVMRGFRGGLQRIAEVVIFMGLMFII